LSEEIEQKRQEFELTRKGLECKKQEFEEVYDLYGAFGCDVGSGWYTVLRGLCAEITAAYERAELPVDIVVDQVKEKFAKLRFYYHYHSADHDPGIHVIGSLGGVGLRKRPGNSELHKEVALIVEKWEIKSASVSEHCGAPGILRNDIGYWVRTLCDACYTSIKQKINEQVKRKRNDGQ